MPSRLYKNYGSRTRQAQGEICKDLVIDRGIEQPIRILWRNACVDSQLPEYRAAAIELLADDKSTLAPIANACVVRWFPAGTRKLNELELSKIAALMCLQVPYYKF